MKFSSRTAVGGLSVLLAGLCVCGRLRAASPDDSPFLPPASQAANGGQSSKDAYELAGLSASSRETQICIFDTQTKRSHWITIGSAYGDVQAVSCDLASDQAVIIAHGSRISLTMRKTSLPKQGRAPAGIARPPTYGPQVIESAEQHAESQKQALEARMLVSDLMDISMQQRKAYEEAQKKAQEAGKTN